MDVCLLPGGCSELDELGELWREMLEHHRRAAGEDFPVRSPEGSWVRTRADYEQWLRDGSAHLLIARDDRSSRPVGYVLYLVTRSGAIEAERLYRQLGFRPWNQSLLGSTSRNSAN